MPATDFENPVTDTRYRLRLDGTAWRITKATTTADGRPLLRHLRGQTGPTGIRTPGEAVDRLVRGQHQGGPHDADPHLAFAEAVLLDLDRTADHLTTLAHGAQLRCEQGGRGFRPGCAILRNQQRQSLDTAIGGCKAMAEAWIAGGLGGTPGLPAVPEWLANAEDDAEQVARAEPGGP